MPAEQLLAADYSVSGSSDTILRLQASDQSDRFPLYEYLRLSVSSTQKDGSATSLHIGGWGRVELGDNAFRNDSTDGDLQFGYLSYRGARNNLVINAGRQFVNEGVATERLDGLYARNDFRAGFGAAVYIGSPVVTEPNFKADDLVYGGRVTQSNHKYYTIGLSALKSHASGSRYREEEGIDLWLHPVKLIDITGRSSYNSITDGWMEHAYTASFAPIDKLQLYGDLSSINYRDYFYKVTTSALLFNPLTNGIDPNEELLSLGAGGSYALPRNITVAVDYRHYDYKLARSAEYYGGKVSWAIPDSLVTGLSIYRMDGRSARLKYTEYRLFATKKLGATALTLDLIDQNYDSSAAMSGVRNAITVVAAGSYAFSKNLLLGASMDYSHNPLFDNQIQSLVKLTYFFNVKRSTEGRKNGEK